MQGKRVLIIDDHSQSAEALKKMIERRNGFALCAQTLEDGLRLETIARQTGVPYQCVVCDLCLPRYNAFETIKELEKLSKHIAVRAMTGMNEPDVIEACHRAGIGLIFKGTPAEGIIESILYAIAEHDPDPALYEQIGDGRGKLREIPIHVGAWFLFRWLAEWPGWAKIVGAVTAFVTVIGSIITVGATVFKTIDSRAIARESARESTTQYNQRIDANEVRIIAVNKDVRELQDDRIRINTKLDSQSEMLDRIWRRVDGQPPKP